MRRGGMGAARVYGCGEVLAMRRMIFAAYKKFVWGPNGIRTMVSEAFILF